MNIRQKMKLAKRELKELDSKHLSCTWDMYVNFSKQAKLRNVVYHKRKFNKYTNDKSILKDKKLTYMELSCGTEKLFVAKNTNGKPLSNRQYLDFIHNSTEALFKHVPVIHDRYKNDDRIGDDFHVMYCLYHSVDRTKSKNIVCRLYIYQYKGNKNLYIREDGKWRQLTK